MQVETWSVLGRVVAASGEDLYKLFDSKFAGLFEAVDSLTNFHVDETVKTNFVL